MQVRQRQQFTDRLASRNRATDRTSKQQSAYTVYKQSPESLSGPWRGNQRPNIVTESHYCDQATEVRRAHNPVLEQTSLLCSSTALEVGFDEYCRPLDNNTKCDFVVLKERLKKHSKMILTFDRSPNRHLPLPFITTAMLLYEKYVIYSIFIYFWVQYNKRPVNVSANYRTLSLN